MPSELPSPEYAGEAKLMDKAKRSETMPFEEAAAVLLEDGWPPNRRSGNPGIRLPVESEKGSARAAVRLSLARFPAPG
ncbi:hypothetical protein B8V81_4295 [Paenibacillus pasadenensis]|uniref:Uncharacterized protein n=1 Tax=Paenibacillus pasadenensis TaxID=217090 RepID=A0A2N5N684_9BACL|nr:hypothetical protein B8V81_4295 [Paenibacillus pasadenensis]